MPIDIETTEMWPAWQHVFKELLTNGAIDSDDFPEFVREQNGVRKNRLNEVLRILARPSSHRNRVKYGFTEQRDGVFYGAVVRIGRSQYVWEKEIRLGGGRHDILYTDDEVIRQYNTRQWRFRNVANRTAPTPLVDIPELVNPAPANIDGIAPVTRIRPDRASAPGLGLGSKQTSGSVKVETGDGYRVLSIEEDRLVVQGNGKLLIATITDRFGLGVGA